MTDLKTIIDAQLMTLESVAERMHRYSGGVYAGEIDAAVAGIKSALDRTHASPERASEELMLEAQAAAVEESRSMWSGYSVAYERGYLAAAKRYARPAAPKVAEEPVCPTCKGFVVDHLSQRPCVVPERERLWREYVDYLTTVIHSLPVDEKDGSRLRTALGRNADGSWRNEP